MLVEKLFDLAFFEMGRGERILGEQRVVQQDLERRAEPAADGDGETHFLSSKYKGGQVGRERFAKELFAAAVEQHLSRQGRGEMDQLMIEEWAAYLERMEHRAAIDFGEQVFGEIDLAIDREGGLHRVAVEVFLADRWAEKVVEAIGDDPLAVVDRGVGGEIVIQ